MSEHVHHRPQASWLGWIAIAALATFIAPTNQHMANAQEAAEIAVAAADPGEPPAPKIVAQSASENAPAPDESSVAESSVAEPSVASSDVANESTSAAEVTSSTELSSLASSDDTAATANDSASSSAASENAQSSDALRANDAVRTLSVEPGIKPIMPADRPAWVGAAPDYTSNQHFLYIGSLPTVEELEADEALDEPLVATVRNYIDQEVVNEQGAASKMPINAEYIRRNLIDDSRGYLCELATSQGSMFQKWVTVRVTPEQRELFKKWHVEAEQRTRLAPLGAALVSALALVSIFHFVLRRGHRSAELPPAKPQAERPTTVRRSAFSMLFKTMILLGFLMLPAVLVLASLVSTKVRVLHTSQEQEFQGTILPTGAIESHADRSGNLRKTTHVNTLNGNQIIIHEHMSGR